MRCPKRLTNGLLRWVQRRWLGTPPDRVIAGTYLQRWYLTPWTRTARRRPAQQGRVPGSGVLARLPAIFLHAFGTSDDDRALHDHPAASVSLILRGRYHEHVPIDAQDPAGPTRCIERRPGDLVFRRARAAHRISLPSDVETPVITLFAFGPRLRRTFDHWGFWCSHGWRHWRSFSRAGGCE